MHGGREGKRYSIVKVLERATMGMGVRETIAKKSNLVSYTSF